MQTSPDSGVSSDSPVKDPTSGTTINVAKPKDVTSVGIVILIALALISVIIWNVTSNGLLGSPSTDAARAALSQDIASQSKGEITLSDFRKTDGQNIAFGGIEIYKLHFTAQVKFHRSGTWISGEFLNYERASFTFSPVVPGGGATASFQRSLVGARVVQAGELATISGVMEGQKTERGWNFKADSCRVQ